MRSSFIRLGTILFFLSISLLSSSAQNDSGPADLEGFDFGALEEAAAAQGIIPPMLPSAATDAPDTATGAEETVEYTRIELRDYNTRELINSIHVDLTLKNIRTGDETRTLKYVDETGILELDLEPANWDIILKVDDISTDGNDYYVRFDIDSARENQKTVYLFPVGTLRGVVYDSSDRLVPGAQIKFECSSNYGETGSTVSDEFGSFTAAWLPLGMCRISAVKDNDAGFHDVEINKGKLAFVSIALEEKVRPGKPTGLVIGIVLFIVMIIMAYSYAKKREEKKEVNKEKVGRKTVETKEEKTEKISQRASDIIKTLSKREREITEFLIKTSYKSTQAKIRNETGIPKTSLARIFKSLEGKKVVSIESIGKLKKVALTDWFLGK